MFTNNLFKHKTAYREADYHPLPDPQYPGPVTTDNLKSIFKDCADFQDRSIHVGGKTFLSAHVVFLDGVISGTDVSDDVIRPLTDFLRFAPAKKEKDCIEIIARGGVFSCTMNQRNTLDDVVSDLTHGYCAVLFNRSHVAMTFEVKTSNVRSVDEPTVEKAIKGAKDAFVETLRINTALIRRRLASPRLKLFETSVGRKSLTRVSLLYIEDVAEQERVNAIKERLEQIDIDGLLSAGTLEEFIVDNPRSPFPQAILTERPDKFSTSLTEGRIGLLADGIPIGFLFPATLPQFIKVPDDDAQHFIIGSSMEILRYLAMLISVLLPALYVAIAMYHQEMLPLKLLQSIIESKQKVPFSTAIEILGMLVAFELLQEAGIRLPESIGQTVSIIGALIVGQSAVEAQVISPIAVIVVAFAGTGGYTQPSRDMGNALRLTRMLLTLAAIMAGMFGIMAGLCLLIWHLCSLESLGMAYMSPICDCGCGDAMKQLLRLPFKSVKYRDQQVCGSDQRKQR